MTIASLTRHLTGYLAILVVLAGEISEAFASDDDLELASDIGAVIVPGAALIVALAKNDTEGVVAASNNFRTSADR